MRHITIEPARWEAGGNGEIHSPEYGDVYASRGGAWLQAQAVFVAGCGLDAPAAHATVRVLETGFGLGVNFLATWAAFDAAGSGARLRYVSVEKHPFTRADLQSALAASVASAPPELAARLAQLASRLVAQWPPLLAGFHALQLDERTSLTLAFGDVDDVLAQIDGRFDAVFLDGFAPDRNPAMWSPSVMQGLARLCTPGARLASWCVAGAVRRALVDAGFTVGKMPGFGGKRERLEARLGEAAHAGAASRPASAIVIGAGVAGASVARQLAERGVAVTVLERERPACGGSGNPVGVVRPEPGAPDRPIVELTAAAVGWLRRWIGRFAPDVPHDFCGALRMARDERRQNRLLDAAAALPPDWICSLDAAAAGEAAGQPCAAPAFHLGWAGWVQPPALVSALLRHPLITLRNGSAVARLRPPAGAHSDAGQWEVRLEDGTALECGTVILCTAFGAPLSPVRLPDNAARGQLSLLPQRAGRPLHKVVCRDGYVTPAVDGFHVVGATLQHDDADASARRADDEENFVRLQRLLPGFAADASELRSGRVGYRSTVPDRVPLVGRLAPGLWCSMGHGARGVTCAPLCGEWLAAWICGDPSPLPAAWRKRLDPLRFAD